MANPATPTLASSVGTGLQTKIELVGDRVVG
jgi:hypothetical protein